MTEEEKDEIEYLRDEQSESEVNEIIEETVVTRKQVLEISSKFLKDWGKSPSMGFIAGQIRPIVTVERVRQIIRGLEAEGIIERIPGNKYYKGFTIKG
jgi:hypothetical protein